MEQHTRDEVQQEFTRQAGQMASASAFRAAYIIEWLTEAVEPGKAERVLDLACGPGIVAEAIASRVGRVTGIDATPEMIRLARDRFEKAKLANGEFSISLAERLPFEDAHFTQIITRLSFHHFVDVRLILAEMRRVLRPAGRLILADIVASDDPEEAALHNSLEKLRDPTHIRMLTRSEVLRTVEAAGFRIERDDSWQQPRAFEEWAAIPANRSRTEPLEQVMRALARAGRTAGIGLREQAGELVFQHNWLLVSARARLN